MKVFVSISLMLALLLPACMSQQIAPPPSTTSGYDVASCSPTLFYAVHFDSVGNDLKLTLYTGAPGEVEVLDKPIMFKFQKEDADGKHYVSSANEDVELTFKFEGHTAMGLLRKVGTVRSMIFGFQADGTKLSPNSQTLFAICKAIQEDDSTTDPKADPKADPKTDPKTDPKADPKAKSGDGYNMPDSYFKPIVKI